MNNKQNTGIPAALAPPHHSTTLINSELIEQVVIGSRRSQRGRIILPLHKNHAAPLHRMLNGIQPGSYIQPHRHLNPPKAESVIVLQGAIRCFIFTNEGKIEAMHTIRANSSIFGVDSDPGVYHTFLATEDDTVLFEVKPGPYSPANDKDFASWAPQEGSPAVKKYMQYLYDFKNPSTIRII